MWLLVSRNRNGWNAPSNNGTPEPTATGWSFTTSSSISGRSAPASFPPPHSQDVLALAALAALELLDRRHRVAPDDLDRRVGPLGHGRDTRRTCAAWRRGSAARHRSPSASSARTRP